MNLKIILVLLVNLLVLSGCFKDRKAELQVYVEQVKSKSIGQIEPLPEVKPYETFTYSAQALRSPFEPQVIEENILANITGDGIRPDVHRRKEALENYALDALRMVGTLEQNNSIWAIVVDTDGAVHRIKKGSYVGQNHGKIHDVSEESILITEIIPNGSGGWREREASMTLAE